jgi:hypothetical protein
MPAHDHVISMALPGTGTLLAHFNVVLDAV